MYFHLPLGSNKLLQQCIIEYNRELGLLITCCNSAQRVLKEKSLKMIEESVATVQPEQE